MTATTISLGAYLSPPADAGDPQLRFEAMRASIARTSADDLDYCERQSRE
ncbi:hypothetical protein KLP28_12055 [Nocardioidaceae bacterium]|nr:hypothetical protein KLP28_12055 [Nocardioidaceae bacterium]